MSIQFLSSILILSFYGSGCDDQSQSVNEINPSLGGKSMRMDGGFTGSLGGAFPNDSNMNPGGNQINDGEYNMEGGEMGGNQPSTTLPSDWTDPDCLDGQYQESLPNLQADISDLIAEYTSNDPASFIFAVLERRYPMGKLLVEEGQTGPFGDCIEVFLRDRSSAQAVIQQLSTIVHECGHAADLKAGDFTSSVYLITPDLTLQCMGGDTLDRGGRTFARSLINQDDYALDPCFSGPNCDFYRDVYLDGDPTNSNFEGGDQGYNTVLEETTQYINSIAIGYTFNQELRSVGSVSERDGILTFLWYITRYLKLARTEYPDAYTAIAEDACWREATLTLWGRAWLYLEATESMSNLGINDQNIKNRLDEDLLGEIQRLRNFNQCSQ